MEKQRLSSNRACEYEVSGWKFKAVARKSQVGLRRSSNSARTGKFFLCLKCFRENLWHLCPLNARNQSLSSTQGKAQLCPEPATPLENPRPQSSGQICSNNPHCKNRLRPLGAGRKERKASPTPENTGIAHCLQNDLILK